MEVRLHYHHNKIYYLLSMKSFIILFTLLFFLIPSLKYHRESFTNVNQVVLPVVLQKSSLLTDGRGNYTYSLCGDDSKWRKKGETDIDCSHYLENKSCNDIGEDGRKAQDACPISCGMCPNKINIEKIQKFDSSRYRDPVYVLQEEATKGARGGVSEHKALIEQREKGLQLENYLETDDLTNRLTTLLTNIDAYNKEHESTQGEQPHNLCKNYNITTPCVAGKERIACEGDTCGECNNITDNVSGLYGSDKKPKSDLKYFLDHDFKRRTIPIETLLDNNTNNTNKCVLNKLDEQKDEGGEVTINAGYFLKKINKIPLCKKIVRIDSSGKTTSLAEDCPYGCGICR